MLPLAHIEHFSPKRLRLRIVAKRGDLSYFEKIEHASGTYPGDAIMQVQARTGSVLVVGETADIRVAADFGRENDLFHLQPAQPVKVIRDAAGPLNDLNTHIRRLSGDTLDFSSALFAALLLFGVFELLRGNWKTPPWYTAFWYAAGIFSKSISDQAQGEGALK